MGNPKKYIKLFYLIMFIGNMSLNIKSLEEDVTDFSWM